jgi:hypothetical protein
MSRVGESERNRSSRCAGMRKKNPYSHRDALLCDFPNVLHHVQGSLSVYVHRYNVMLCRE